MKVILAIAFIVGGTHSTLIAQTVLDTVKKDSAQILKVSESANKKVPVFNPDVYVYGYAPNIPIPLNTLKTKLGETVTTTGKVYCGEYDDVKGLTLLYIGADDPNQDLIVVIKRRNRAKFGQPEITLTGKIVKIHGDVIRYKHKTAVYINEPADLSEIKFRPRRK
jgi:hypothetical protein